MTTKSDTPIQRLIDSSSHCMVEDGAGKIHAAVKAKISDLRILELEYASLREAAAMLAAGPTEEEVGTAAAVASIEAYGEHAQKLARAVLRWKDGK